MKAKVIREPYRLANLKLGEVVEIIPGMETDAEGIWNVPAGKLVLCKKGDGTYTYSSLLDMEVIDETPSVDWDAFRREAAKDALCALLSDSRTSYSQPYEWFARQAIALADELIMQLRDQKNELTWQDIAKILSIYELEISSGNISRYGDASDVKPTSERILDKFNETKK